MKLWVDADSCPKQVRDLVLRTGYRRRMPVHFVANRPIPGPSEYQYEMTIADATPDAADDYIVEHVLEGDLVISRDIPLAKRLVDRGVTVLNDRGTVYTERNIGERLATRNLMLELYNSGFTPEKTGTFGKKEMQEFANALDREITRITRSS